MRRTYTFTAGTPWPVLREDGEGTAHGTFFATSAGTGEGKDLHVAPVEATTSQTDCSGVRQEQEAEDDLFAIGVGEAKVEGGRLIMCLAAGAGLP